MSSSDSDDVEKAFESFEVDRVPGAQREFVRDGDRSDQEVDCPGTARFATMSDNRGIHTAVRAGGRSVERERLKGGLGSLQPVLPSSPFLQIRRGMGAGSELGQGNGGDRHLGRQLRRAKAVQINDH